ncbi:acetate/propionate family kinase [Sphingomonas sp. NSE70-1]|uniref:Acetate kinase n=1 Tax=Sphingomonas caseinilyticus TaxID=2908205 RepID=A0ABT0RXG9_9SPHN|nr:acetate/propionate family kinase [Sphingomonas caseinilyticus]MCL6699703.1 acetate/propionate family kinase [Sphingomonas caseinilyticus]
MAQCIAVVNAGSSSVKFGFYDSEGEETLLLRGAVEQIGVSPTLSASDGAGNDVVERSWPKDGFTHAQAMTSVLDVAREFLPEGSTVVGVGHRVVHGGTEFAGPAKVSPEVIAVLEGFSPLAPLHQPHNLAPIKAIAQNRPDIPQVACFDTAFHQTQPHLAQAYALPRELSDEGIKRYGFHGLSYDYVSSRLREVAPDHADKKIIIAHLGNGASVCAIDKGKSVATTMGFTAVEGLVMGTRCGSIDPGVLIYLMDEKGMDARALETLVYKKCGLLGVSGISSDMRTLRGSDDPRAREAIDLFIYRIVREIGSLAAALGGVDGLVFTGGIGQRDAKTRREVAAGCAWLGAELDEARNGGAEGLISTDGSALPMWVVQTDEELVIARQTAVVLGI